MKAKMLVQTLGLSVCIAALSSCVLGKREISLEIPAGSHPSPHGQASIGQITDLRRFENNPSQPSTPSIQGDAGALSAAERERYVGRQRNTYGHGMGEVVLPANDSVTKKARALVIEALARRGYSAGGGASNISVEVRKFWGWMTPGMWAITIEARIEAGVSVKGRTFTVQGYGENVCQAATTGNWEQAYGRAIEDFLKNLEGQLATAGM
jgi:hypothetical protein